MKTVRLDRSAKQSGQICRMQEPRMEMAEHFSVFFSGFIFVTYLFFIFVFRYQIGWRRVKLRWLSISQCFLFHICFIFVFHIWFYICFSYLSANSSDRMQEAKMEMAEQERPVAASCCKRRCNSFWRRSHFFVLYLFHIFHFSGLFVSYFPQQKVLLDCLRSVCGAYSVRRPRLLEVLFWTRTPEICSSTRWSSRRRIWWLSITCYFAFEDVYQCIYVAWQIIICHVTKIDSIAVSPFTNLRRAGLSVQRKWYPNVQ